MYHPGCTERVRSWVYGCIIVTLDWWFGPKNEKKEERKKKRTNGVKKSNKKTHKKTRQRLIEPSSVWLTLRTVAAAITQLLEILQHGVQISHQSMILRPTNPTDHRKSCRLHPNWFGGPFLIIYGPRLPLVFSSPLFHNSSTTNHDYFPQHEHQRWYWQISADWPALLRFWPPDGLIHKMIACVWRWQHQTKYNITSTLTSRQKCTTTGVLKRRSALLKILWRPRGDYLDRKIICIAMLNKVLLRLLQLWWIQEEATWESFSKDEL